MSDVTLQDFDTADVQRYVQVCISVSGIEAMPPYVDVACSIVQYSQATQDSKQQLRR